MCKTALRQDATINVPCCMALGSGASGARNNFLLPISLYCVMHNLDIWPGLNDSVVINEDKLLATYRINDIISLFSILDTLS